MSDELMVGDEVEWFTESFRGPTKVTTWYGGIIKRIVQNDALVECFDGSLDWHKLEWIRPHRQWTPTALVQAAAALPRDDTMYEDAIASLRNAGALGGAELLLAGVGA